MAAWLIMVGSAIVVVMVFDRVAGLHTLETRESVERFLSEPPVEDLGIGVEEVITVMRTAAMVAAGCATAALILGYQVLRRSRSARVALTVIAIPLFVTGMITGGFVSSVVAAASAMLWLQPARDWFRGVGPAAGSAAGRGAERGTAHGHPSMGPPAPPAPPADPGPDAAGAPAAPAAARPGPVVWSAAHLSATSPSRRPAAVGWACALTWVFSALTAAAMLVSVALIAASPDLLLDEVHKQNPDLVDQGVTESMLTNLTYVMVGIVVAWSVSAIVLAVLVYRRVDWARIALVVSCAACAALCLGAALFGAFLLAFPLVASIVTLALLVRPDTRPWFQPSR